MEEKKDVAFDTKQVEVELLRSQVSNLAQKLNDIQNTKVVEKPITTDEIAKIQEKERLLMLNIKSQAFDEFKKEQTIEKILNDTKLDHLISLNREAKSMNTPILDRYTSINRQAVDYVKKQVESASPIVFEAVKDIDDYEKLAETVIRMQSVMPSNNVNTNNNTTSGNLSKKFVPKKFGQHQKVA